MRSTKTIHVISAHAEGEVGDVIVGGVAPPPGETIWEQRRWIAEDQTLRNFVLNEPRGGVFRHVNLLVPPKHPEADAAFIIMEPEHTPPMSGSNSICVATVLLDSGILPMREPVTEITLEAPGGLVRVRAECRDGKAERIFVRNLPSFAERLDASARGRGPGHADRRHRLRRRQLRHRGRGCARLRPDPGRGARHRPPGGAGSPTPPTRRSASAIRRTPTGSTSPSASSRASWSGRRKGCAPAPPWRSSPARSTARPPGRRSRRGWRCCTPAARCARRTG